MTKLSAKELAKIRLIGVEQLYPARPSYHASRCPHVGKIIHTFMEGLYNNGTKCECSRSRGHKGLHVGYTGNYGSVNDPVGIIGDDPFV